MAYRLIHAHIATGQKAELEKIRESECVLDSWRSPDGRKFVSYWMVVASEDAQTVSDKIQPILNKQENQTMVISLLETIQPKPSQEEKKRAVRDASVTREELYEEVLRGTRLNRTFILLVILSTIVASIGLLADDIAVVIGAMVIAPLLGPNIALALSTALGDRPLATQALKANLAGLSLCLLLSYFMGYFWQSGLNSEELLARTDVNYAGIALAIASGAAGALSLTTGVSSVLVGVMVSVALLPPAATFGIMMGADQWQKATGACLLLFVNIVSVNLAAKVVFWFQGIHPRSWYKRKKAKTAIQLYVVFWLVTLAVLAALIYVRHSNMELPELL